MFQKRTGIATFKYARFWISERLQKNLLGNNLELKSYLSLTVVT